MKKSRDLKGRIELSIEEKARAKIPKILMEKSNFLLKNNSDDNEENDSEYQKYMLVKIKKEAEHDKAIADKKRQKKMEEQVKSLGLSSKQLKDSKKMDKRKETTSANKH